MVNPVYHHVSPPCFIYHRKLMTSMNYEAFQNMVGNEIFSSCPAALVAWWVKGWPTDLAV